MGILAWLCASLLGPAASAQTFQGASSVLRQVEEQNAKAATANDKTNDQAALSADVKAFGQAAASLPPAEAARRWLDLVDRTVKLQQQPGAEVSRVFSSMTGSGCD